MSRIEAVIFDMDGLLIDSEVIYFQVGSGIIESMGFEPDGDFLRKCTGLPENTWRQHMIEHYGPGFDGQVFAQRSLKEMRRWYTERSIPLKKGAIELLEYLKNNNIPCAVASSTYSGLGKVCLNNTGIYERFAACVFGDMVQQGKPAPDIFLAAAKALGKSPERCMGLEDSFNGIRASHAAGLYTVMVPDLLSPTREILTLTDGCVTSLLEVIPILDALNSEAEGA